MSSSGFSTSDGDEQKGVGSDGDEFVSFSSSSSDSGDGGGADGLAARLEAMHAAAEKSLVDTLQSQLDVAEAALAGAQADLMVAQADVETANAAVVSEAAKGAAWRVRAEKAEAALAASGAAGGDDETAVAALEAEVAALRARASKLESDLAAAARSESMAKSNAAAGMNALKKKLELSESKWAAERAKMAAELAEASAACNELTSELARASSAYDLLESRAKASEARVAELEAAAAASPLHTPPSGTVPLDTVASTLASLGDLPSSDDDDGEGGEGESSGGTRSGGGGERPRIPTRKSDGADEAPARDPETMRALADKLAEVEVTISKQLKVLDGVNMVRDSFETGSSSRERADDQYKSLVWDLEALETQRNILESQLQLPQTPKIKVRKRKRKKRARADTILRKIKKQPPSADKYAVLDELSEDELRSRMTKVAKSLKTKKDERAGLQTFLKPDSPFKYESNSAAHNNLVKQIAEVDAEIADLTELHASVVARLGLSEPELERLESEQELAAVAAAIDKQTEVKARLAALPPSSHTAAELNAADDELRKLLAREDALCAALGVANHRAPLYDPSAFTEVLVAVYDYVARADGELSLVEGDRLGLLEDYGDGWSAGVKLDDDGAASTAMGLFPTAYAEPE